MAAAVSLASAPGAVSGDEAFNVSEEKRTEALACIERARQRQMSGDIEGAQVEVTNAWYALEEALETCPMNHRARFLLVSCAMNADDYSRAKTEGLRIYHDLNEDQLRQLNDSVLHLSITHTSKMLGEPEDAIKFATEATTLFPDDPQPYMVLGELHMAGDDHPEAEQRFRQALMHNDNPQCRRPLNEQNVYFTLCCLGAALANQGKYSEAEMFLVKASRLDGSSTLALSTLVDVYHFQGQPEKALQIAERIVELDPEDDDIRRKIEDIQNGSECSRQPMRQPPPELTSEAESLASCPTRPGRRGSGRLGPGSERSSAGGSRRGERLAAPAERNYAESEVKAGPPKSASGRKRGDNCLSAFCCFDRVDEKQPV